MRKYLKRLIAISLITLFVFSLSGCGGTSKPQTEQQPAEQKTKPTQIIMSRPEDSVNLDPVMQDGNVNIWMFNLVMEGLVKTSDDGTKIESCLAESWDISDDKVTYTFHLRKGVKFSDGSPLTVEDWVFSLNRARTSEGSPWKFALEAVKDVIAKDENTLVITLKEPWAPFLADLAMFNATVTSKAYFEKLGEEGYSQKPLGTGPYYIEEWKKGEYLLFKKNPYYWREGLPKTDEIKVVVVPDDNTRIMQLQSGDVDIATFIPFNRMEELKNNPNLNTIAVPSTETRYAVINTTRKIFSDAKVRQALHYATDKDALVKMVLYGYGEVATSFMPKSGMYWNDQLHEYSYDIEKAKQLLKEAGYPNGFDLEMITRSGNIVDQQIATVLKEQWSKIGVNVNIVQLEAATATQKYRNFETDIALRGWTNDICDPSQLVDYACVYDNIKCFYTGWKNDEVEKLAKQGKTELDPEKRKEIYFKIQELFAKDTPLIYLFYVPYPVAMQKNITGFVQTPLGNYRFENLEKK